MFWRKPKVKVGQVWQDTEKDPFVEPVQKRVMNTRDGYVQYMILSGLGQGHSFSQHESAFKYGARLIKDV